MANSLIRVPCVQSLIQNKTGYSHCHAAACACVYKYKAL